MSISRNKLAASDRDAELSRLLLATFTKAFSGLRSECRAQNRGTGLTMVQLRALSLLHTSQTTNRDLAGEIGLSVAATSRLIATLKTQGLVQCLENPTDRRESFLQLTQSGQKTLEQFQESACAQYAARLAKIPETEKRLLSELLPTLCSEIL